MADKADRTDENDRRSCQMLFEVCRTNTYKEIRHRLIPLSVSLLYSVSGRWRDARQVIPDDEKIKKVEVVEVKKTRKARDASVKEGTGSFRLPRRDTEKEALVVGLGKKEQSVAESPRGKVLVMDDEDVIRTILSVMLLAFGYEAHLTADGDEAIRSYVQAMDAGEPFDAVIIDLNIPGGLGGGETMKRLAEIDPGVKAIVSSGYSKNPAMENYREHGFLAVLHKPYSISELRNVLNKVMQDRGHDSRPGINAGATAENKLAL